MAPGNGLNNGRRGQSLVEVALIFPLFLIVVFGIMQLGHIATMTILVNHATFEVARIGAIASQGFTPGREASCSEAVINQGKMNSMVEQIFEKWPGKTEPIEFRKARTLIDPEVNRPNCDLVVTLRYKMPLVFPFVNIMMSQPPYGGQDPDVGVFRMVTGEARMPLEVPIWN
ncbi:MAG: pilus assembly protein [Elusimicrobia bacterium]|nr:pilus assembly protein [Elusimicrobiota bacterium]